MAFFRYLFLRPGARVQSEVKSVVIHTRSLFPLLASTMQLFFTSYTVLWPVFDTQLICLGFD